VKPLKRLVVILVMLTGVFLSGRHPALAENAPGTGDFAAPAACSDLYLSIARAASMTERSALVEQLRQAVAGFPQPEQRVPAWFLLADAQDQYLLRPEWAQRTLAMLRTCPDLSLAWKERIDDRIDLLCLRQKVRETKNIWTLKSRKTADTGKSVQNTSWWNLAKKAFTFGQHVLFENALDRSYNAYAEAMLKYESQAALFPETLSGAFGEIWAVAGAEEAQVALLADNAKAWLARWWILSRARQTIDVQYFYLQRDPLGLALLGILLEKARQGVMIRLMVDGKGDGRPANSLFKKAGEPLMNVLTSFPNVVVRLYNPFESSMVGILGAPRRIVACNHDKIVLVDNTWAVTGGRNLADYYFTDREKDAGAFVDMDVLVSGPIATARIKKAFDDEFNAASLKSFRHDPKKAVSHELLDAAREAMNEWLLERPAQFSGTGTQAVFQKYLALFRTKLPVYGHLRGRGDEDPLRTAVSAETALLDKHSFLGCKDDITDAMVRFTDAARREILFQNPMIILTDRMTAAIKRAVARGVKVTLHTNSPSSTDSMETQGMFVSDWNTFLGSLSGERLQEFLRNPPLRVYAFETRKLHSKAAVFDDDVAVVGSYNLDFVSEQINSEIVVAIRNAQFVREVKDVLREDIAGSREFAITVDEKGRAVSPNGPDSLIPEKQRLKLQIISRLRFLRPFM
jgi:putative cardiolipin synthase